VGSRAPPVTWCTSASSAQNRTRETRRYAYVVDGSWYEATVTANPFLERGEADLREGIAILGGSPAADRLAETVDFVQFLRDETRVMMLRWHERKATLKTRRTVHRA
jgi:hypothetical protein